MIKKYNFALIIIFAFIVGTAALPSPITKNIDSLLSRIKTKNVEEKIKAYIDVMDYYRRVKPNKSTEYGEEAVKIARRENYKKGEGDILYLLGIAYHAQSNYPKALECYQLSLEIKKKLNDKVGIGECLNRIGLIYNVRGDLEKALDYCLRSIKILENQNNTKALAESFNNLGILYYILNDIPKALEICNKALKFSEVLGEDLVHAVSHEHLAVIYIKTKEYDKALYHVNMSLEIRVKLNDRLGLAGSYENLAIIYRNTDKYDEALKYHQKSYEYKKEINNVRGVASSIFGIGVTYYKMGRFEESLGYIKQSFEMRKKLKDKRGMVASLIQLAEVYSSIGNYKNAYEYSQLSKVYSDSLLNEQKNKAIAEYQEAFQQERRDKEILLLQKENTIQKYWRNFLLLFIVLLTAIAILISFAYRSKRKVNAILLNHNNLVTSQKEELEHLNAQLKELVATKDKFFSIIAHDLKSPFQGLLGYSQILSSEYSTLSEEEKITFINSIGDLSQSSYRLLENLLEWSRIQTGNMIYNPESFNLLLELYPTLSLVKQTAKNKDIECIYTIDGAITIKADKNMLSAIIRNLVSNAIKFTNPGGSVSIDARLKNEMVEIAVADTGIGIDEGTISKLFNVEKSISRKGTANEEGTGLGLLLCREMIEKHGGKIFVESQLGKGTKFTFTIPVMD